MTATGNHGGDVRSVALGRIGESRYQATNIRGGTLVVGDGSDSAFTPVELLLAALAACGALDLEAFASRRAPYTRFDARAEGWVVRDEQGSHVVDPRVIFDVAFPEGAQGDAAREIVEPTLQAIRDRLCTVGRTVALGEPVAYESGVLATPAEPAG
jgi:uncharacterized OsmC-like protein